MNKKTKEEFVWSIIVGLLYMSTLIINFVYLIQGKLTFFESNLHLNILFSLSLFNKSDFKFIFIPKLSVFLSIFNNFSSLYIVSWEQHAIFYF